MDGEGVSNRAGVAMSDQGQSTEPRIAGDAVAGCDVGSGSSRLRGDVDGPGSYRAIILKGLPGGGPTERCADGGHAWAPGSMYNGEQSKSDCERPKVLWCVLCHYRIQGKCGSSREDVCGPCSKRHRKDVARIGRSGAGRDRPEGIFFGTVTAPGVAAGLGWDKKRCSHDPALRCDGKPVAEGGLGCKTWRVAAALWNATAPRRWNNFVTDLRREFKGRTLEHFGSWEPQGRGLLHRHFLARVMGVSEQRMTEVVKGLLAKHGFGAQFTIESVTEVEADVLAQEHGMAGDAVASADESVSSCKVANKVNYIVSYTSKGKGGRSQLLDFSTGLLRPPGEGYRTWSRSWGWCDLTMKRIKLDRRRWIQELMALAVAEMTGALPADVDGAGGVAALD